MGTTPQPSALDRRIDDLWRRSRAAYADYAGLRFDGLLRASERAYRTHMRLASKAKAAEKKRWLKRRR